MNFYRDKKAGFTLVEMSIVLVIIGLVVGGALVGRDLLHAARLNKVISEMNNYKVAVTMFQDKMSALPGDMTNATAFWPSAGTADGDGDGLIW